MSIFREYFKKWPIFYYFVGTVFGPVLLAGLNPRGFLKKYKIDGKVLNIGSGPRRIASGVINMDIEKYEGVDIVGDATNMPFDDNTISAVICDNVLEHVKDPQKVAGEINRVLNVGGVAYISTPFIYPFHSSPYDFTRWTKQGLEKLFSDFDIVEIGSRSGPFSSLVVCLCYLFATIFSFGNSTIYWFLVDLFMFVFFPIKFLDVIFNFWPNSINMAAVLYVVVRKKDGQ
ncbi:MAG: Methylase involved in ubiquinone/menaquinone biosynthesis [Parcubacteria group bacterium GW2011_GWF2_38_76]|nr:MAG: Methylase involved in ubiquinone/menaquinone biosynthesis [Parcubacteria group bacterium GW2011_GWF2_38_76]HBM45773.1 hypothetical protein [Patescibacteria group bacterium]